MKMMLLCVDLGFRRMGSSKQLKSLSDEHCSSVQGGGGFLVEVGTVPCVDCLMKRKGAQHSEYESRQSAMKSEMAGTQIRSSIYA